MTKDNLPEHVDNPIVRAHYEVVGWDQYRFFTAETLTRYFRQGVTNPQLWQEAVELKLAGRTTKRMLMGGGVKYVRDQYRRLKERQREQEQRRQERGYGTEQNVTGAYSYHEACDYVNEHGGSLTDYFDVERREDQPARFHLKKEHA